MSVKFESSKTKENLMKAFAGESQARNRYTFAAGQARKNNLYVIESIFKFTADQEKEHAEIFYNHLKELSGKNVNVEAGYPVNVSDSVVDSLRYAQHNEYEEHDPIYKNYGDVAREEGFNKIAFSFHGIAEIENTHGNRFGKFADLLEQDKLFKSEVECEWMCLNCGYIYNGKEALKACPVCSHDRGYFIRLEMAPFT